MMSVFDTNVYRRLTDDQLAELMALERARSVIGGACYQVCEELLAHLARPDDPEFAYCRAGLRRLALHCQHYDGRPVLRFLPDALDQVARSVHGRALDDGDDIAASFGALIGSVVEADGADDWAALRPALGEVSARVVASRAAFTRGVREIASKFDRRLELRGGNIESILKNRERRAALIRALESEESCRAVAGMFYRSAAASLGMTVLGAPSTGIVNQIMARFPTPPRAFARVVRKAICDGFDVEKHETIAYDVRISFLVTGFANFDGVAVRLVTGDRDIHDAATAAGTASVVFWPDDYRAWLNGREAVPGEKPIRARRG